MRERRNWTETLFAKKMQSWMELESKLRYAAITYDKRDTRAAGKCDDSWK